MAESDVLKFFPDASHEGVYTNPDQTGAGDSLEAIERARSAYAEWTRFRNGTPPEPSSTRERDLRKKVFRALASSLGVESDVEELVSAFRQRHTPLSSPSVAFHLEWASIIAGILLGRGEFWWGETSWWTPPSPFGTHAYFDDAAGGVKFVGQLDYDDGDLWWGSAGAVSTFGLGTDRMPDAGPYVSRPPANLFGEVWGFTGVNGPFSFGDNWCKCWLHLDQTIRSASGTIVGNAHEVRTLIFYEADGQHGVAPLPGSFSFPEVRFDLNPTSALTATLEVKFDIQLEGSATFRFGNYGGWVPALLQTPQWFLEPL